MPLGSALRRWRQEDYKFKIILGYDLISKKKVQCLIIIWMQVNQNFVSSNIISLLNLKTEHASPNSSNVKLIIVKWLKQEFIPLTLSRKSKGWHKHKQGLCSASHCPLSPALWVQLNRTCSTSVFSSGKRTLPNEVKCPMHCILQSRFTAVVTEESSQDLFTMCEDS